MNVRAALISVGLDQIAITENRRVSVNGQPQIEEDRHSLILRAVREAETCIKKHRLKTDPLAVDAHFIAAFIGGNFTGFTTIEEHRGIPI